MEVLAHASLSRYSCRIGVPHGGICTHRMSLYAPCGLTKYVAIHAAFPYNRDQMREQTCFDAYHIFCGRKAQVFQCLVRPVVADQHFTKSVYRLARTYMLSQPVHRGGKHFLHPFLGIPRSSASLTMCQPAQVCSASVQRFVALCGIISTSTRNSSLKAKHRPLFVQEAPRLSEHFAVAQNHDY